jgi:hypothetical protein
MPACPPPSQFHHGEDDVRPPPQAQSFAGRGRALGDGPQAGGAYFGFLPAPTMPAPLPSVRLPARSTAPIDLRSDDDGNDSLEPLPAARPASQDEVEFVGEARAPPRAPPLAGGVGSGLQLCKTCGKRVPADNFALHKARCRRSLGGRS